MRQVHFDAANAFPQRNVLADLPVPEQMSPAQAAYEPQPVGHTAPGSLGDFTDRDLLAAVIYKSLDNKN